MDVIEIFQGTWERCAATRVTTNASTRWPATIIVTNVSYSYNTNDPSGLAWYTWTDTVHRATNYYKTVTATNSTVTTNRFVTGRYRVTPPRVSHNFTEPTSEKYIFGGYTQYVISGITGAYATNNGTYQWVSRTVANDRIRDTYTNATATNGVLYDYGPRGRYAINRSVELMNDTNGNVIGWTTRGRAVRFGPWSGTGFGSISVAASGLSASLLTDAWCETNKTFYNALSWITDSTMMFIASGQEESPGGGSTLGPDKIRSMIMTLTVNTNYAANHPYVDDSQADSNGHYVGFTALPVNTFSQFVARVGAGYATNQPTYSDSNFLWMVFHDEDITDFGFESPASMVYWPVTKSNLQERYEALNALKWTHMSPVAAWPFGTPTWIASQPSNRYYWVGVSTNSWGQAQTACSTSAPTITTVAGAPYEYTEGEKFGATYTARAFTLQARMRIEGVWTGLTCTVDFYGHPDKKTTWDAGSHSFIENEFNFLSSLTNAAGNRACVTSGVVGIINSFPSAVWCNEPSNSTQQGWIMSDTGAEKDAVLKWSFGYCTNSIP